MNVTPVNDPGSFTGDTSATIDEDTIATGVLVFSDGMDGFITPNYLISTDPNNGDATIDTAGNWSYTPTDNFSGNDTFSDVATYTVNDDANQGTVTDTGSGSFTYTPTNAFDGSDSFTYSVLDVHGNLETRTVNIALNTTTVKASQKKNNLTFIGTARDDLIQIAVAKGFITLSGMDTGIAAADLNKLTISTKGGNATSWAAAGSRIPAFSLSLSRSSWTVAVASWCFLG